MADFVISSLVRHRFLLNGNLNLTVELVHTEDLELVRRALGGDERAFEEIVRRFSPRVFQIASRFFRQRGPVEDVSQEVFLKAYSELKSYKGRGSLEGWISRIAVNTCLNIVRRSNKRKEWLLGDLGDEESRWLETILCKDSSVAAPAVERSLVASDLAEKVLRILAPEDRLVLLMIDGEGSGVSDVAELTGWSQSKVKVRAMRARLKIRRHVAALLR